MDNKQCYRARLHTVTQARTAHLIHIRIEATGNKSSEL